MIVCKENALATTTMAVTPSALQAKALCSFNVHAFPVPLSALTAASLKIHKNNTGEGQGMHCTLMICGTS